MDQQLPLTYDHDGLSTIHNADFLHDARFQRAIKRAAQAHRHYPIEWRTHIVLWAAQNGMRIEGDFVECGVNRGYTTSAILDYLDWNNTHDGRRFYLMDTFHGLVEALVSAQERAIGRIEKFKDIYTECYELARQNFAEFDDVILIRGTIPASLSENPATKVAFLHIDMNCALPEVAALRHFWPKLTPGAVVVLDDYAYHGYFPQKEAIDALGRELGFTVLSLPTGGGMIIKQHKNIEIDPNSRDGSTRHEGGSKAALLLVASATSSWAGRVAGAHGILHMVRAKAGAIGLLLARISADRQRVATANIRRQGRVDNQRDVFDSAVVR